MAGGSLFTLLDDVASLMDDVAVMTKVAAKKTVGLVGDDLALNANQVQGVVASREWPVIWSVAKGSLVNKLILIPLALVLSFFANFLINPLLMLGGAYLCFEGVEKILHARQPKANLSDEPEERDEKTKIRGAIRTDFVLSAEIIVISLGTIVGDKALLSQLGMLCAIGLGMTVGVYGLVAGIVKIDDLGLSLVANTRTDAVGDVARKLGRGLLVAAPWLMKFLSVAGTIAMFLVGGEILLHGVPALHPPEGFVGTLTAFGTGIAIGFVVVGLVSMGKRVIAMVRRKA